MKLVFFSPFLETSAIGRSTALVASALVELGHEVVVVRAEHRDLLTRRSHTFSGETLPWTQDEAVLATARNADALVYEVGDNFLFHEGCLHWMSRLPGIVCLHDFFVAHLFYGWSQGRRAEAEKIIERWYGPGVSRDFFGAASSETFIEMARLRAPMTEWICAQALAVISHSQWGMLRVTRSCPGPVRVVPLAYDAPGARPAPGPVDSQRTLDVTTVGHVNANKRAAMVIRAIGSSALLRNKVRYRLCGLVEPETALALAELARTQRVDLLISGEMERDALQATMNETDVICALRWPSLEAASATAIEGLLYGKAVIVTNTGFYSEIPDGLVHKIQPDDEIPALKEALEKLLDPVARHAMASHGQAWAASTFTASNYARQLLELIPAAAAAAPVIRMVDQMAQQLSQWGAAAELIGDDDMGQCLALFD